MRYFNENNEPRVIKIIKDIFLGFLFLILFFSSFEFIGAGERGVVLNWGAVSNRIMNEGLNFKIPIYQKVKTINIRTQKIETNVLAYSNDIQTVDTTIALNYHLSAQTVNKLYQEVGSKYDSVIISPAIQEAGKSTIAEFTAQELVSDRQSVKEGIKTALAERLGRWNITVDEFSIANFDFSDQYENAIEDKQVAGQKALEAKNDLERVKMEAEQKITQARAEAEAIKIQAQAVTQQGGKDYVQLQAIQKWNGQLPTQMVPNASVPFLDLTK